MALLHTVTPELGQPASICIEGRPHEWSLGISPRLCNRSTLILFFNQLRGSTCLSGSLQADASELGCIAERFDADRPMFANSEPMTFQLATTRGNPTKFVQIPESSCNLVDRSDDDVRL